MILEKIFFEQLRVRSKSPVTCGGAAGAIGETPIYSLIARTRLIQHLSIALSAARIASRLSWPYYKTFMEWRSDKVSLRQDIYVSAGGIRSVNELRQCIDGLGPTWAKRSIRNCAKEGFAGLRPISPLVHNCPRIVDRAIVKMPTKSLDSLLYGMTPANRAPATTDLKEV